MVFYLPPNQDCVRNPLLVAAYKTVCNTFARWYFEFESINLALRSALPDWTATRADARSFSFLSLTDFRITSDNT